MLDINDFKKKQIVVYSPCKGDKLSYQNDNLVIRDGDGKIRYQHTCYRIFMIMVVGDTTITTGLLRRAKKFGFSICFMSMGFKVYSVIGAGVEGNTLLHQKQYSYDGKSLAQLIVHNKIMNQRKAINKIRNKTEDVREGIALLDEILDKLSGQEFEVDSLLGIEGTAAKVYFARIFNRVNWKGRKPRIKFDYINSLLDIGYNLLFNFIDAILQVFGFDTYKGFYHTCFYMRKSLVCDIMEPFRPIIDWKVRTGIQLGQFKKDDFVEIKGQWQLEYKKSSRYAGIFMEELLGYKEEIFLYIRSFYRSFMRGKTIEEYPLFDYAKELLIYKEDKTDDNYQL